MNQEAFYGLIIFLVVTAVSLKWGGRKKTPPANEGEGRDNAQAEHRPEVKASQGARAVKPPPGKVSYGAKVPPNKVDL